MAIAPVDPAAYAAALTHAYESRERWTALQRGGLALANKQEESGQFGKDVRSILRLVRKLDIHPSKRPSTHFFSADYMQLLALRQR
jgi:hypothetical protein